MGNIIDDLKAKFEQRSQSNNASLDQEKPEYIDPAEQASAYSTPQQEQQQQQRVPYELNETPEQEKQRLDNEASSLRLGTRTYQNLEEDPETWSPEYTNRSFVEESINSVYRGVGKFVIGGTGDMLQVAGAILPGITIKDGNAFSRTLKQAGEGVAEQFKTFIPEDINPENLDFDDFMNPKLWSIHVAEMIPQVAEFLLLSKGGSAVAKWGTRTALTRLNGLSRGLLGTSRAITSGSGASGVVGSGSGIMGALTTEAGLTAGASNVVGAIGGGIVGNQMAGLMNAAELVNQQKLVKDPETGEAVYSKEDLQQMAANVMKNNAWYLPIDALSYGITFGKQARVIRSALKNGKIQSVANAMNKVKKSFAYDLGPITKPLFKLAKKAVPEGIEETFQESFEEWAKMQALAEAQGDPDELLNPTKFWDFYKSKENRGTVVLSAAMGALAGAGFNIPNVINQRAEESLEIYNRTSNLLNIINKQGKNSELNFQTQEIRRQIGEIVAERDGDSQEVYEGFINFINNNENITEEEKKKYDEIYKESIEAKQKAKNLNVRGLHAFVKNNADEKFITEHIEELTTTFKENVKAVEALAFPNEQEKQQRINELKSDFKIKLNAASDALARSKQNQENLILGKKAKPYELHITTNKYGNEMFIGGLSTDDYYRYTKSGVKEKKDLEDQNEPQKTTLVQRLGDSSRKALEKAGNKTSDLYKSLLGEDINIDENVKDDAESEAVNETEIDNDTTDTADGTTETNKEVDVEEESEEDRIIREQEEAKIDEKIKASKTNDGVVEDNISDEEWNTFEEGNSISVSRVRDIANKIYKEEPLSNRENTIRNQNPQAIRNEIVNIIGDQEAQIYDDQGNEIIQTNELSPQQANEITEDDIVSDADMSPKEREYQEINVEDDEDETLMGRAKKSLKKIKKKFSPKNVSDKDIDEAFGKKKDKRDDNPVNLMIRDMNKNMYYAKMRTINRLKYVTETKQDRITQDEVDDFLNSFTARNIYQASEIEKMAVVNHRLKKMFPSGERLDDGTIKPYTRVYNVKNLYETVGSEGIGTSLAGTIFIDDKVWDQDNVFMHEMSHVWFQLSENEPETQKLIQNVLKDEELIKDIMRKYKDQILYSDGENTYTYGSLYRLIASDSKFQGLPSREIHKAVQAFIKENSDINALPLSEQKYIIEEAVVTRMETPLGNALDKSFELKERQRQADTIKWFGMLKKKGEIVKNDNDFMSFMESLNPDVKKQTTDPKSFFVTAWKKATEGVNFNSYGVDKRVDENNEVILSQHEDIAKKILEQQKAQVDPGLLSTQDIMDQFEDDIEEYGESFFDKSFDTAIRKASRMLRRFGAVYNRKLRKKFLQENKNNFVDRRISTLFDREMFEAALYDLSRENEKPHEFIRQIENSTIAEIKEFNAYLDKVLPDEKYALLNSMHFVMANSKHIQGFKTQINKNEYSYDPSFSQREMLYRENILDQARKILSEDSNVPNVKNKKQEFLAAVNNLYNNSSPENYKNDLWTILNFITNSKIRLDKIMESGYVTYKGVNMPVEVFVKGYIKTGNIFNKQGQPSSGVYFSKLNPMISAFIDTNRKYTAYASVKNAKGDYEPTRIVNNFLTKEIDSMSDFLSSNYKNYNRKPTKKEFLMRYSHLNYKYSDGRRKDGGKSYVPNILLEHIYDRFQKGFPPQIMQYHGIADLQNTNRGNTYKDSTSVEQGLEQLLIFLETSRTFPKDKSGNITGFGKTLSTYLGNLGAMSDSPRNFYMAMPKINYSNVFYPNGNIKPVKAGNVWSSIFNIHKEIAKDPEMSRTKFIEKIKADIDQTLDFVNQNKRALYNTDKGKLLFEKVKKEGDKNATLQLTDKGRQIVMEYAMNAIVHGHNLHETLIPSVKGESAVKRLKSSSSPVFSVKNPNLKLEVLPISDEIIEQRIIAGTDSGQYILEEDAERYRKAGRGVMDLNNGFKFLDSHVEKDHPQFKNKLSYLKGYTTIVGPTHPLYKIMKARKDKYVEWHTKEYEQAPSDLISDGTANHVLIASFVSADKSNMFSDPLIKDVETTNENGETVKTKEYTNVGQMLTPQALSENIDEAMAYYDQFYYNKDTGAFQGLSTENFGVQQVMDKTTYEASTPVQMINSVMVNAIVNGRMDIALKIQEHIAKQKQANLNRKLKQLSEENPTIEDYERFVDKHFSKEDMNQAERLIHDEKGSISNPYIAKIASNTFIKALTRAGNKLITNGTYAHQKPDIASRGVVNRRLRMG
jgi:hypothetical protein